MNNKEILNLRIDNEDFDHHLTIKGYLKLLLTTIWEEGEDFSGKRPFGNSGWEYDLYTPLVKAGVLAGILDEDGYIDAVDKDAGEGLVCKLIDEVFKDE